MGKMRILSKKTFALGPGASKDGRTIDQFITVRGSIQEIDERFKNDPTFQRAVKAGEIIVMNSSITDSKVADILEAPAPVAPVPEEEAVEEEVAEDLEQEEATQVSVKEFYENLKLKKHDEVKKLADQYNAEFIDDAPLKENKKRVLEAYKLSLS